MLLDNLKNENVVIVSHVFVTGPAQELEEFLAKKVKELLFIGHPFSFAQDRRSFYKWYKNGVIYEEKYAFDWNLPGLLCWFKDIYYTLFWTSKFKGKFKFYIGADNLNAFIGLLVKRFKKVQSVIFYTVDYVPKRFESKPLNMIYHRVDKYCVKNCDKVWNLSENMTKGRKRRGIKADNQLVVPIGVHLNRDEKLFDKNIDRMKLVYMGHLREGQGLELIIEGIPELIRNFPDLKLIIIGMGSLMDALKKRIQELAIAGNVEFTGYIENHREVERILSSCGIGLAPYEPNPDSFTWYADPSKPKQYMASGLPVVITKVPQIAEEIQKGPMGIVINYNKNELINAIIKLLEDRQFYNTCRHNVIEFCSHLRWEHIFEKAFSQTLSS